MIPPNDARLVERAFHEGIDTDAPVPIKSQRETLQRALSALGRANCACALAGPEGSGKTTIIRRLAAAFNDDVAVAVVDGPRLSPGMFLSEVLAQFGYTLEMETTDDLLRMINVFAVQQTRTNQAPVLMVENVERMYPGALRVVCLLATLTFQGRFAVRIVLSGDDQIHRLLRSEGMAPIAARLGEAHELEPFSATESMHYLHGRLSIAGCAQPDRILPLDVCDRLHRASAGLPGALNDNATALLIVAGDSQPCLADVPTAAVPELDSGLEDSSRDVRKKPRLIVTTAGKTLLDYQFKDRKVLAGRSAFADIVITNRYASKAHALFIRYSNALVLFDLNSANGTFVNSRRIKSAVLRSNDIISIASHRIKVVDAPDVEPRHPAGVSTADTATMKTLDDMRELRTKSLSAIAREQPSGKS